MAEQSTEQRERFASLRSRLDQLNVPNHSHRMVGAFEARRNGDEFVTIDVADLQYLIECAEHAVFPDS